MENKKERGFSLIELLVVITIMGLLASVVVIQVTGVLGESKADVAKVQISAFEQALEVYYVDNSRYPTTDQGLEALVALPSVDPAPPKWRQGGYLKKGVLPPDPWGIAYKYLSPGVHNRDFDIWSTGADGEDGGEGEDADVTNWQQKTQ